MTHLASKLTAAGQVGIEQAELAAIPADGHVRLELATASLCGTDLHYFNHFANAGFMLDAPVTLGHEACAHVVDANGSALAEGQLVAVNPIIACGRCPACKAGQVNHCSAKRFPGSATTRPHIDGFFRERFDFPAACCHPVADDIDPDHLTFAEPLACAMHAVARSGVGPGKRVVVTGCGPMGLLAIVAAKATGAEVAATDIRGEAVALARQVGAADGYVTSDDDLNDLSSAFDAAIEASGAPKAFNQTLDLVRKGGRVVILSNIQASNTPIDLHRIMLKEIDVTGSMQFNEEFLKAVDMIVSGQVDFDRLIAARLGLSDTGRALELMAAGGASGKILLKRDTDL